MTPTVHASCVAIAAAGVAFGGPEEAGVLLLGPSGAGKSDLALRLIAAGAMLVADDRTALAVESGRLVASAPANLVGLIEVRNLGIIALPCRKKAPIALAVELAPAKSLVRLPRAERWRPPGQPGLADADCPPLIRLDPFETSAAAKIAVATAAFAHALFREQAAPI